MPGDVDSPRAIAGGGNSPRRQLGLLWGARVLLYRRAAAPSTGVKSASN
jgi:hypothetical protein